MPDIFAKSSRLEGNRICKRNTQVCCFTEQHIGIRVTIDVMEFHNIFYEFVFL